MPRTGGTGGGGGISQLSEFSFRLFLYSKLNPSIWDVIPQVSKYSRGTLDVIGAQIIKAVAFYIEEENLKKELNNLGLELYSAGTKTMNYDDDWFCGNIPFHIHHDSGNNSFFFNSLEVEINPQPQPPREKYLGAMLGLVGESISNKQIASKLIEISNQIIENKGI